MADFEEYVVLDSDASEDESCTAALEDSGSEEADEDFQRLFKINQGKPASPLVDDVNDVRQGISQDGTVAPSDLMLSKKPKTAKKGTINGHVSVEDLAEVVILVDSPKKAIKSTKSTPLSSPMKKMTMEQPKTPISPLKRKRRVIRDSSEESSFNDKSESEEEIVVSKKMPVPQAPNSIPKTSLHKSKVDNPSPRKVVKKAPTPKDKTEVELPSSPTKSSSKRAPRKVKAKDAVKTSDEEASVKPSTPRKKKEPVFWSEAEIEHLGKTYMKGICAMPPSTFKAGLEEIWAEDESLRKSNMDINNHLTKWRKAFQAVPATIFRP